MSKRKIFSAVLMGAWLCVALSIAAVPARASTSSADQQRQLEIAQQKQALRKKIQIADEQATAITAQIARSDLRRDALQQQAAELAGRLATAERDLAAAEADLGVARVDLANVEGTLASTLGRLDDMRSQIRERTRQVYQRGGAGPYVSMLLGSDSFGDFVSRLHFVRDVVDRDRSRLAGVEQLTQQLESSRQSVNLRKDTITAHKTSIEQETAKIAGLRQQVLVNRQQVVAEIATRQSLLGKVKGERAAYMKQMSQLDAESRSLAALIKNRQRGQVYVAGSGKRLAWPTTGSVSSTFGWRIHPIFGDRRMHTGIDITGSYGQAVTSAESGTVIYAASKGGYGTTVIIDHGNALATLYAHLSSTSVSVGQTVTRGQRIAAVGCSGFCTGPHLHFETRIDGEPRDPMGFF